ncbi:Sm ribonucleo [Metallosphaera tengchongensis]|uniref:Sm ribonucleo n=1 Tax=Metallosphaera tengchongensis TaxID=1532350 RepID=A0A6N0NTA3_9CREN|nr:U6 snRNA-associated Sm-like protein LSm6 [Metallosphaera tengchongensis]QKQ99985.1 Sm ribonucleo [Metallosphaera tengchongensis]
MQAKVENPLKSLRMATNKIVLVKLKDGSEYIGKMEQSDGTMNLVLRDCTELREGTADPIAKYGRVLIRGSNVLFVSIDYENVLNSEK